VQKFDLNAAPFNNRSTAMPKIAINELELAERWGISPKTLQRWRSEGRGPRYFKLSKRVCYPLDQILAFENGSLYESTSERSSHANASVEAKLVSAREVATALNLPMYLLTHPKVRHSLGLPFVYVGKLVRFNLDEVTEWARRCAEEVDDLGHDTAQNLQADIRPHVPVIANLPA
jgi:predicted DNA-binding transcriptional regulator AlpA